MPVVMHERPQSRGFTVSSATEDFTAMYYVGGTTNEAEVYATVVAGTPAAVGAMVRKSIKADPLPGGHWFVDVTYGTLDANSAVGETPAAPTAPDVDAPLGPQFSFDTTGGTVHITQARATRYRRQAADGAGPGVGTAPDPKLAIGVSKDRVEGTDIYAPAFKFSITVTRVNVTLSYINSALYGLVGRVNNAAFYQFAAGEVLYLGCSGNFTFRDRWSITHNFACQPNETNIDVGGGITLPDKKGWDYVWVGYDPKVGANKIVMEPSAAYVQTVYKTGDFSLLEVGA